MDETEFLRGLEGEEQAGTDLVSGAEHFVRLKIQTGLQKDPEEGLELNKEAVLQDIGRAFTNLGKGVKDGLKWQGLGAKGAISNLKREGGMATGAGQLIGQTAPGLALGAGAATLAKGHKEKKAEDKAKLVSALVNKLKGVDPGMLAAMGIGAVGMGTGTYLASRPQEDTGKSKMEEQFEGAIASQQTKPERGLLQKMKNRGTEFGHGLAQAYRDHPVKASLMGAATGAAGGYGLARMMGAKGPAALAALKAKLTGGR